MIVLIGQKNRTIHRPDRPREAALAVLVGYCYYAQIYGRSPVGLPIPRVLEGLSDLDLPKLNQLLQEIAWTAVTEHSFSGVKSK